MATGRPSKYKKEYCELLVDHMAQGLSFESFAGVIRVNRDTLYEWEKTHPPFSDAKKEGSDLSRLFWEKAGISGMHAKVFQPSIWIFNMKNRFGWKDKQELEVKDDGKEKRLIIQLSEELNDRKKPD